MKAFQKKVKKDVAQEEQEHILTENSPFAIQEAYKTLRTNVIFSLPGKGCKTVVITSGTQGEAKSTTSVSLAIAFAQNKSRVLLIDCDLRLPTDARKLGINQEIGLSNVLIRMNTLEETICHLPSGLDVLPAGEVPPNPTELLGSDSMRELLDQLKEQYDYIILDTPPVCVVADASILASKCSGVLVVVRENMADSKDVDEALEKLEFSGAKIMGFAFTGVSNGKNTKYYKYYK